ncbi:MAG: hypothetical protein ACLRNQ_14450 [Flavonifractor plautii]
MASSSMSGPLWPPRSRRLLGSGRRSRRPGLWTGLRYPLSGRRRSFPG